MQHSPRPFYPKEPFDQRIQGTVALEAVVNADGSVGDVRVLNPLHPHLDETAMATARRWRFTPAMKSGQPLAVLVRIELSFQLKRK